MKTSRQIFAQTRVNIGVAAAIALLAPQAALAQDQGIMDAAAMRIEIDRYYGQRVLISGLSLGTGVVGTALGGYLLVTQNDHKRRIIGIPLLCHGLLQLAAGAMLLTTHASDQSAAMFMMDPEAGFLQVLPEQEKINNLLMVLELGMIADSVVLAGSSATFLPVKPFEGWFGFAVAGTVEGLLSGALAFSLWQVTHGYNDSVSRFIHDWGSSARIGGSTKPMTFPVMFRTGFTF